MREYIVTCKTKEDLQSLYDDMETPGGNLHIPDRAVELANRRPISRNTHYMLTAEEAEQISNDDRVLGVELTPEEIGVEIRPQYTSDDFSSTYTQDSSRWSKSSNSNATFVNWGLIRCINGATFPNWGSDNQVNIGGNSNFEDCIVTASGKNVDVVIVDGCFDPAHPEFAVNNDGTGGSRVNQFNWFSLTNDVTGGVNGTYTYTPYIDATYPDLNGDGISDRTADNDHGCHVAGTACGNLRGWARDATIYNINPYGTAPSTISSTLIIDYIRVWHQTKSINSATGKRNPTITNHSYGIFITSAIADIDYIIYRGQQINSPNSQTLFECGLWNNGEDFTIPYRSLSMESDIADAIADGILFVGAAGNSGHKSVLPGNVDYDNRVQYIGDPFPEYYYHRGTAPTALGSVISVGAISALQNDSKADFSVCGEAVDVYAPGQEIISSVHDNGGGANDSRDSNYNLIKYQGTSMASPQVCGILAVALEHWPRMNQMEALGLFQSRKANPYMRASFGTEDQIGAAGSVTNTWNVVNSSSSFYSFSGFSSGNDINITATEGTILTFNVTTNGDHPFWIKTAQTVGTGQAVTTGIITNNGAADGTITWDTRGVNAGTYYYICEYHSGMSGEITISQDTSDTSLQGGKNLYAFYPNIRQVPDEAGGSYVGAAPANTPVQAWPRGNKKVRPILSYGYNVFENAGDIDEDVYGTSKFIYPRQSVWHRG